MDGRSSVVGKDGEIKIVAFEMRETAGQIRYTYLNQELTRVRVDFSFAAGVEQHIHKLRTFFFKLFY